MAFLGYVSDFQNMKYRPEIDGIRAFAILLVLFYHAGFSIFQGGYVGVDVFFVISGYLITLLVLRDVQENNFSFARFYERRARRILPALTFIIIACLPFAWFLLVSSELEDFGRSILSITLFASNFFFAHKTGYFDTSTDLQPLMHTWSLAIEEQYYLVFPILILFLWKYARKKMLFIVIGIVFSSFFAALFLSRTSPDISFYLLPTRAWELLAGSGLAICEIKYGRDKFLAKWREYVAFFGLVLLGFSHFLFTDFTTHPGLYTVMPVLGTALLIWFCDSKGMVAKFLSLKPFVGIGLISYSLYLWHQPVFAFFRIWHEMAMNWVVRLMLISASVLLSIFTWKFVESPFRNRQKVSNKHIWIFSSLSFAILMISGFVALNLQDFPGRTPLPSAVVKSFNLSRDTKKCFDVRFAHESDHDWLCTVGDDTAKIDYFFTGDSHANAAFPAFAQISAETGLTGAFSGFSGCIPFLNAYPIRKDQLVKDCHALNEKIFNFVKANKIKKVFLIARWSYYTNGDYEGKKMSYVSLNENDDSPLKDESRDTFLKTFQQTVDAYQKIGAEVILLTQVPMQKVNPRYAYWEAYENSENPDDVDKFLSNISVSLRDHKELTSYASDVFMTRDVKILDTTDLFCNPEDGKCEIGNAEQSYYFDDDHLSAIGSLHLVNLVRQSLVDKQSLNQIAIDQ